MFVPQFIRKRLLHMKNQTVDQVQNAKDFAFRGGIVALIMIIIIWAAIFLYIAFYYTYMPSISHIRPVHLQFKSCDETRGLCSFPSAHVQLTKRQQLLMVGQPYRMYLNLDMPESPANKRLGMFMVCIQLHDKENLLVSNSCRSTMLHYRSYLVHVITTFVFSPFMIFGSAEEKQSITLEMYNDFEEDQNHPVTDIYVEIQSRHVELYSAVLHVHARFTGLRYLMFHWPVLSAIVGISSNLFFIVLVCLLSWLRLYQFNDDDDSDTSYVYQKLDSVKKVFVFKGEEADDSSFEESSFIDDSNLDVPVHEEKLILTSRDYVSELSGTEKSEITRRTSSSDC